MRALKHAVAQIGRRELKDGPPASDDAKKALIWRNRAAFGITRIGSVTRLDRIGVPVVQTVRPSALSNVVSQGKGFTFTHAFISSAMEAIETWAAERIPNWRVYTDLRLGDRNLFGKYAPPELIAYRIDGIDLLTGLIEGVPISLVETRYIIPPPFPVAFDQTTTGLGAGFSADHALIHALSETVERYSMREAETAIDLVRLDQTTIPYNSTQSLLQKIKQAGAYVAIESAEGRHALPVIRCRVADEENRQYPRLPALGYGCRIDQEGALNAAILEAVQARLAAISGSREDITRMQYPPLINQRSADELLDRLRSGDVHKQPIKAINGVFGQPGEVYLCALKALGAQAVFAVPIYADLSSGLCVIRVVAPPLFGA
ncbi:YcaO-like family protein [Leisingera caerulea]|uniref:YcaO-like family protein n=1 Tax=Leisingera caerulea TaxID=506591 RepID=UPI0021A340EB|nr:YcaO-like family protein [Leisingera caerulea]UWQ49913.1 YcaO-like family protein [Leisingera caerulea]